MSLAAKVMLLGDIGVGKSSLARRIVFDRFESDYKSTIGVDILTHDLNVGGSRLRLILWDTDGDFGMSIFDSVYLRGAAAAIVIADASRPATLVKMANLARGFDERLPGRPLSAVVNKIDLVPAYAAGVEASVGDSPPERVSALTGEGVAALFMRLGEAILRRGF